MTMMVHLFLDFDLFDQLFRDYFGAEFAVYGKCKNSLRSSVLRNHVHAKSDYVLNSWRASIKSTYSDEAREKPFLQLLRQMHE